MTTNMRDLIKGFDINSAGYGIIPKLVMLDRDLHVTAKAIYAYFCSYTGAGDTCFPSRKKICYDLNISFETFTKHLKTLITSGYVKVEQIKENGRFSHNLYTLSSSILPCTENSVSENSVYGKLDTINNIDKNNKSNKNNSIKKEKYKKERKEGKVEKERDINFEQDNSNNNTVNICEKDINNGNSKSNKKNTTSKNTGSLSKIKNDAFLIKEAEKEKKKNSAKRKKESESFNSIIHSYTQNEEMQELLTEFIEIREKIKRPLTPSSFKRNLKTLDRVALEDGGRGTDEEKIKIIERTVINSWQRFYSLKSNAYGSPMTNKVRREKEKPSYDIEAAEKAADEQIFW